MPVIDVPGGSRYIDDNGFGANFRDGTLMG